LGQRGHKKGRSEGGMIRKKAVVNETGLQKQLWG